MWWVGVEWGLMGLRTSFLASQQDARLKSEWNYPGGSRSTFYTPGVHAAEMLAWSRWQLGWLDEAQVRCVNAGDETVALAPVAQPGNGIAMVAVPLSGNEVIVIESRRRIGYDTSTEFRQPDGAVATKPALLTEGVLVYTVNASIGTGQLPIKVAGDPGTGTVDDYPILTVGNSVTVSGYTITVVADDGDTHTVTIAKTEDS